MNPQSNFKLRFSERSLDVVRGFLFQFGGVTWEVWLPGVLILLKVGHCKARNVATQQLQIKIF